MRPGGLRRQLRFAARRFRLGLLLGGVCPVGSAVVSATASAQAISWFAILLLLFWRAHASNIRVQGLNNDVRTADGLCDLGAPCAGSGRFAPVAASRETLNKAGVRDDLTAEA